jgi:hypothetical protein
LIGSVSFTTSQFPNGGSFSTAWIRLSGTVFAALNLRRGGRGATVVSLLWIVAAIVAIVLAAFGNPSFTPSTVWFLIGLAVLFDTFRRKRR